MLWHLERHDDALAAVTAAISSAPRFAEAYFNRANMLRQLHRKFDALADYARAIALRPDFVPALNNRAGLLQSLGRYGEALADLDRLVELSPDSASAHYNRGVLLLREDRFDQAWDSLSRALALSPDHADAFGALAMAAIGACDFARIEEVWPRLMKDVSLGRVVIPPVILLGQSDDLALQLQCSRNNLKAWLPDGPGAAPKPLDLESYDDGKLRIAYMSSDFGDHPVGRQIASVIEQHDRSRVEVIGLGLGANDRSALRNRICGAFDRFHDLSEKSDAGAAALVRQCKVHVLIDLNGQTEGWRPAILRERPAPVQVSFLGFAGSGGADFIDYVIADDQVIPQDAEPFYSERVVRLPGSFWPGDARRPVAVSSREDNGLPREGFVFCAFNNHHKIGRAVFACWMRLLDALPGSILWLRSAPETVVRNLRRSAAAANVDPSRVMFAPVVSDERHLGRHRLADLYLDTAPYNAHSSASDALLMGLPVLTLRGQSFAGRVASSMLHALDLGELVTDSLAAYEECALALGRDKARLDAIKARLALSLATSPLFDSKRFCANLEAACSAMWSAARKGEEPRSFSVPARVQSPPA